MEREHWASINNVLWALTLHSHAPLNPQGDFVIIGSLLTFSPYLVLVLTTHLLQGERACFSSWLPS